MQPTGPSKKMTPYPYIHKMPSMKPALTQLYNKNNLSTLRKMTLPSSRNQGSFLVSNLPQSQTDRKISAKMKQKKRSQERIICLNSKYQTKYSKAKNVTRNELFRERNSVPTQVPNMAILRKGLGVKGIVNHRSNHSLYNYGNNHLFSQLSRQTGSSLGVKDVIAVNSSPKLNQLKSNLGKLKNDLDRKISRDNAKFLKEFDKFNQSKTQSKYVKPKLKLIQKEGQSEIGIKAFSKASFLKCKKSRDNNSMGFSCQIDKLAQNTTTSNTLQQLEKVRVFDVRSKWFKPKKSTNFSEKAGKKNSKVMKNEKSIGKVKNRDRNSNSGLILSLRKKIKNSKAKKSVEYSNKNSAQQNSVDLYSKLKNTTQKSKKSINIKSPSRIRYFKKIYRYLFYVNTNL